MLLKFGLFFPILLKLKFKLSKSKVKVRFRGYKYPFYLRKNTSDIKVFYQVFLNAEYAIQSDLEPKTIIDAGANIGLTSIYFRNQYPNAKIISIEPEKQNFELMSENLRQYTNVHCLNVGLWSSSGKLNIINRGDGEWAFELTEDSEEGEEVYCKSLEDIMQENNLEEIDLLKIDIEGSEKEVFESNYEYWLPKTKVLIIELHDRMRKGTSSSVFMALANYNFSCELMGENLVFTNDDLR